MSRARSRCCVHAAIIALPSCPGEIGMKPREISVVDPGAWRLAQPVRRLRPPRRRSRPYRTRDDRCPTPPLADRHSRPPFGREGSLRSPPMQGVETCLRHAAHRCLRRGGLIELGPACVDDGGVLLCGAHRPRRNRADGREGEDKQELGKAHGVSGIDGGLLVGWLQGLFWFNDALLDWQTVTCNCDTFVLMKTTKLYRSFGSASGMAGSAITSLPNSPDSQTRESRTAIRTDTEELAWYPIAAARGGRGPVSPAIASLKLHSQNVAVNESRLHRRSPA